MAGRPKKTESEARANVLRIRLTEAEREEIDRAAQGRGLDVSAWARSELLRLARALTKKREE
jgi:uncharacterized protein (DUF1778 family)